MDRKTIAYTAPFVTFLVLLGISGSLEKIHFILGGIEPCYLIYPLQTIVCAVVLVWFWSEYRLRAPRQLAYALGVAVLVFGLWISPQHLFHQSWRLQGFDPTVFASRHGVYIAVVAMRFARLVIVVPLLEEIFWRGFLLRYIINAEFEAVPFGSYSRKANAIIALLFMLEHNYPDWPAALAAGVLYNFVAYRTRSLSSCVIAHAVTNALLGAYVMYTHQWGFW